ncbi:LUD domain-containing protein [Halopiger aswanensis]|uniref:L-lactate dehydrogenase complex protein LldG n=1 Tax=Halopiger aswanensis TaxID=148449 RepID=A0A3R7GIU0_9EURY|nr:LUD domain-containing protein [Halopiger aswanensis]RKD95425.1 L-lactate dehydrogenase complex protein LldG [Halopiger aswanensis]
MSIDTGVASERFEAALADLDVPVTYAEPTAFDRTLRSIARDPAIGTPLPFESVSLPEWVDEDPTPTSLESAKTGITAASMAIADYGSVVLPATDEGAEQVSLFPDLHVAVVRLADIVPNMQTAIDRLGPHLRDGGSAIVATGPSATADMGALVQGAHGPKEVHVVVLRGTESETAGETDE